jgi:predicted Zn-dependent protease
VVLVLVAAEASLSRQGLGDLYRLRAQRDIDTKPAVALREANRSLSFDADAVTSYYVKAAALARFDQALAARDALIAALRREPSNFVTWTLLGDIAVRRGRFGAAKTDYSRAHALNPRDPSLTALAADPRGAGR